MTGKKIQRALRGLNTFIDGDRQKLCDELHEIKLSHKRMERLLKYVHDWISGQAFLVGCTSLDDVQLVLEKIERELSYPCYRVNHRVKGGKHA